MDLKYYHDYNPPGYRALRTVNVESDAKKGAWFIQEFILAAELFAHQDHLLDIVTKVCCAWHPPYYCHHNYHGDN